MGPVPPITSWLSAATPWSSSMPPSTLLSMVFLVMATSGEAGSDAALEA